MTSEQEYDEFGMPLPKPLDASPGGKVHAGDVVHFTRAALAWGVAFQRGDTITLTAQQIAETIDARGRSWLDQVGTEDSRIALGPWPQDQPTWLPGSNEEATAYEDARREAHALPVAADRAAALAELAKRFPRRGGPTSTVLAHFDGGSR